MEKLPFLVDSELPDRRGRKGNSHELHDFYYVIKDQGKIFLDNEFQRMLSDIIYKS